MSFNIELAQVLMRRGVVTPEQYAEAEENAAERDLTLPEALIQLRLIDEPGLTELKAELLGMRFQRKIDVEEIDIELSRELRVGFCRSHKILPLVRKEDVVEVAVAEPLDLDGADALQLYLGVPVDPIVVPAEELLEAMNKVFDRIAAGEDAFKDAEGIDVEGGDNVADLDFDIIDGADDAPIIRMVNRTFAQANRDGASDIHIEPFERYVVIRFRVDGILREISQIPKRLHSAVTSRIKVMAGLDIAERRVPQDGRIKLKVAGKEVDIRLSTLPTSHGERLVMRLLDKTAVLKDLAHIGMGDQVLVNMNEVITRSHGIILVTGPTGSGKTTTLYASLSKINSPTRNIITVEDPVEYQLPGLGQTQVNTKVGLTFAAGLRSILRQDPDVVMIGEIRDQKTAEIAIQASLTGHLVFSTLHTNDAAGAVTRLVDMGVEPFLVASSVVAIMAQRLVRRLCPECRQQTVPTEAELNRVGWTRERLSQQGDGYIYAPVGCSECRDSGYRGRTGIYELLMVDDDVRPLIMDNKDSGTIKKMAMRKGMDTLRDDGMLKVIRGITSLAEVMRVTQDDMLNLET